MGTLKNIIFSIIVTILFFALLEGTSRLFVFPGSYDYIERRAIEQNLHQHKAKNEFRVFLFGESTMLGGSLYPYSTIDKWVKLYIADLLPENVYKRVTITNFGRLGAGTRFIVTSFIDLIPYKPDLAVFYAIHNDFIQVEQRRKLLQPRSPAKSWEEFFEALPKKSAFLNLFNRLAIRYKLVRSNKALAKSKSVDKWYNEIGMGEGIYYDDANLLGPRSPEFEAVKNNYENNIRKAVDAAHRDSIPIIMFNRLAKWKEYEPVRSLHGALMAGDALGQWTKIFTAGESALHIGQYWEALMSFEVCRDMDPAYALTYYRIGECYEGLGKYSQANEFYSLANDNDNFPIRAPQIVNQIYEKIRLSNPPGVYFIRTQELFEKQSPHGIIDIDLVTDQIHPSVEGQAIMALEIVRTIYDNDLLAPKELWRWNRLKPAKEMKKALNLTDEDEFEVYLGSAGYVTNFYPRAAKFLEQAVEIKPQSIFARSWLAWTYWKMGESEKALTLYRQLNKDAPSVASEFLHRHPEIAKEI